ncbi:HK97 gp10 family phage protein [Variovorax sp. J22R193]|uniref:HK97 gp10 family phage protein n=1 Tax=Variovorax fucosicus TaxID=3053517 RepID=UPI002576E8A5|nr:HK97 gp10 family phage protein [Variovorax sp. J22R193]MDM0041878.1 HK97 gp10 family phage protein [Variovorax sp. J22R193]
MSSFAFDIQRFCELTNERASTVTRQAALSMLNSLIKRSPVDTGRFRGNWQTTIGAPPSSVLETDDKSGAQTLSRGLAVLADFECGPPIYLVNGLPYGRRLENGYSQQAPSGMVRLTVNEFRKYIAQAIEQAQSK